IFPFLIVACIAFGFLVYVGFKKERLSIKPVLIGFLPFSIALTASTAIAYYGWSLLLHIYPQYNEILHGFPYNGHLYIVAFIVLTLAICFIGYSLFKTKDRVVSYTVAPLFIWLIINGFIAVYVKGASFFIVPVYFCLLLFYFTITYQRPNAIFLSVIAIPVLVICVPFLQILPVGLGLDTVFVCALLSTLIFGLLLPVFGFYKFKRSLALLLFVGFGVFLLRAHFKSNFNDNRQKPNSLLYVFNADENNAYWATYDAIPDDWTARKLGNTPRKASEFNETILSDSYDGLFSYVTKAPVRKVLPPKIEISRDTIIGEYRQVELCITPQRPVNKMDIFADDATSIIALTANGEQADSAAFGKTSKNNSTLLFSYYVTDDKYLEIQLRISKSKPLTLSLNEASFDLLSNNAFTISPRSKDMIPKPFLLNDAVVVKKTIKL
ncbi:MAG: peptidase M28, partial [Bacteroidota bacterium]